MFRNFDVLEVSKYNTTQPDVEPRKLEASNAPAPTPPDNRNKFDGWRYALARTDCEYPPNSFAGRRP